MTTATTTAPRTRSTARLRTKTPIPVRPWRESMRLLCDRCGQWADVRLDTWLCTPCYNGGARAAR